MLRILSILLFLFAVTAHAAEEIRLDQSAAMKNIPVMDQGASGLCYAYATAQLIDFYRFSHNDTNTDHLTSPIYSAARAAVSEKETEKNSDRTKLSNMFPWRMLQETEQVGSCSHNQVSAAFNQTSPDKIESKLVSLLSSRNVRNNPGAISRMFNSIIGKYTPESADERFICEYLGAFGKNSINLFPSLQAVQAALKHADPLIGVSAILKDICKNHLKELPDIPSTVVKPKNRSSQELEKMLAAIDSTLTAPNPQPAGVVLCLTALRKKNFEGISNIGSVMVGCEYHVAVVVGRREKNGKTEYLVRNSMGPGCHLYERECERGQVWIAGNELATNSTHVYYFKGEK